MADFIATDDWSEIILRPVSAAAKAWVSDNVTAPGAMRAVGFAAAPGHIIHTVLPQLRAAGLTVDGDVTTEGKAKIRVKVRA